ncbi:MAG: N-acetylglucosamine-6-phosphate deacetylase [Acidobacteriota bacterium]|nr:N-acetylglucosamine-6-phosphate deacetylase [Acidobacteriota bacterium]
MSAYALHATRFVLPGGFAGEGYLTIRDGRFGTWGAERPDCEVVELGDCWVAPGFVDTHIHGFFGHAATDQDPAGINEASLALARCGTTAWLPTTFTDSVERIAAQCAAIADAVDARGDDFSGARIPGIYLEGPFFTERYKGAQNPAYLKAPSYEDFSLWQEHARGLIVKSALAAEHDEAPAYIARLAAGGVVTALGHSDASFEEGIAAVNAGATVFVHTYNGMSGLHHRNPGLVGCAMATPGTYAELICDGRHVAPGACAALVRAKGWEHVPLVTDCLGCGGLPEGSYTSGGLPVVLKGGLCYLEDMSSIAGSVLTLAEGVRNMTAWGVVSAEQAIRMATEVAARSAGIEDVCGLILPGRHADLVVLAPDLSLRETYVGGVRVRA